MFFTSTLKVSLQFIPFRPSVMSPFMSNVHPPLPSQKFLLCSKNKVCSTDYDHAFAPFQWCCAFHPSHAYAFPSFFPSNAFHHSCSRVSNPLGRMLSILRHVFGIHRWHAFDSSYRSIHPRSIFVVDKCTRLKYERISSRAFQQSSPRPIRQLKSASGFELTRPDSKSSTKLFADRKPGKSRGRSLEEINWAIQ